MAEKTPQPAALRPAPRAVMILAALAFVLACYLLWHSLNTGSQLAGCGGEGAGCNEVLQTKWGSWLGLPVSAGGVLVYGSILGLSLTMRQRASRLQWLALLTLSVLAAGSGLWFVALQKFVIKSYCWYCMSVHVTGVLIAAIALRNVPATREETVKKKRVVIEDIPGKQRAGAVLAGIAGIAILAAGQISGIPQQPAPLPPAAPATSSVPSPITQAPAQDSAGREAVLMNGALRFSMSRFPIFGSPDAQSIVGHFFDFTCPACRQFHPSLMTAQAPYENSTALVMIPVPLDSACNPAIKETAYGHQNACDYARFALAIWNTRPDVYSLYDRFVFQGQFPPGADAARGYAEQLVGKDKLDAALNDPRVSETIQLGLSMFYSPALPNKALPALATDTNVLVGMQPPQLLAGVFSGRKP